MSVDLPDGRGRSGFTILELSIVLVIIGLIAGGIMMGRDLIHSAELRKITTEVEEYETTMNVFQAKYNCLAGDCPFATTLFGTDPSGCPWDNYNATLPVSGTCNGDNSGELGENSNNEPFLAWQQLAYAHLIPGSYSGTCYDSQGFGDCGHSRQMKGGLDVPFSHGLPGVYAMFSMEAEISTFYFTNSVGVGVKFWNQHYGNVITFGGDPSGTASNNFLNLGFPALTPLDAYEIDSKADDGLPASGKVLSTNYKPCFTAASTDNTNAAYDTTSNTQNCVLIFLMK